MNPFLSDGTGKLKVHTLDAHIIRDWWNSLLYSSENLILLMVPPVQLLILKVIYGSSGEVNPHNTSDWWNKYYLYEVEINLIDGVTY